MDWSPKQEQGLRIGRRWIQGVRNGRPDSQVLQVLGYAGTGKTTLVEHIVQDFPGVIYCAPTGKAAMVLRSKGCAGAMTVHSALYAVKEKSTSRLEELLGAVDKLVAKDPNDPEILTIRKQIVLEEKELRKLSFSINYDSPAMDASLIVLDEASMVGQKMGQDLIDTGKPILLMGDPGQLQPIQDKRFFLNRADVMLDEIHRQAKDSGILQLATDIRLGHGYRFGNYGTDCQVVRPGAEGNRELVIGAEQVLCGRNKLRRELNMQIRYGKGRVGAYPLVGDKLVCLRNDRELGLINGMQWTCDDPGTVVGKIIRGLGVQPMAGGDPFSTGMSVSVHADIFRGAEVSARDQRNASHFDHGEAMTVHKAQGSQWDSVFAYDDWDMSEWKEWAYTMCTRAASRLTLSGRK